MGARDMTSVEKRSDAFVGIIGLVLALLFASLPVLAVSAAPPQTAYWKSANGQCLLKGREGRRGPAPAQGTEVWHTSPDMWREPRLFHTDDPYLDYLDRIALVRTDSPLPLSTPISEDAISPNRAYSFILHGLDTNPADVRIRIDVERPYVLELVVKDIDTRYGPRIEWVNEKILFVRVWWGRVLGADILVDVEREKILYEEIVQNGVIPFQQFRDEDFRILREAMLETVPPAVPARVRDVLDRIVRLERLVGLTRAEIEEFLGPAQECKSWFAEAGFGSTDIYYG